jgi:single-stranded DNA-binding protein
VVRWHGLVELAQAQAHLRKGSLIYLKGKLKTRHYNDAAGQQEYMTEVIGELQPRFAALGHENYREVKALPQG